MSSTTDFVWTDPIAVKPELLRSLDDLVNKYIERSIARTVSDRGLNPVELKTEADAQIKFEETRNYDYRSIGREISDLSKLTWSVRLDNDIRRSKLTVDDVIGLPNSGSSTVSMVQISQGNYSYGISVRFQNSGRRSSADISIVGDYEGVEHFREQLSQLLRANTRNWSLVTKPLFGLVFYLAAFLSILWAIFRIFAIFIDSIYPEFEPDSSTVFAFALFSGFLSQFMMFWLSKAWARIFPLAEFQFGGGVNASEVRKNCRKAAWFVPVLVIGMPIITNLVSNRLS